MTEIIKVPIKDLKPLERNPRKIDKNQFSKLVSSLRDDPEFLERRPILVNLEPDGTKRVYAGNQRLQAAKKLKWKHVPCIIDANLDQKIIHERIVKDNKHYGEFDFDILFAEWDVDILIAAGFSNEELTGDYAESSEVSDSESPKKEKLTICPNCQHEF